MKGRSSASPKNFGQFQSAAVIQTSTRLRNSNSKQLSGEKPKLTSSMASTVKKKRTEIAIETRKVSQTQQS